MKLVCSSEVPVETPRLICRESRLLGVIRFLVWCGVLAAPAILGWLNGMPWVQWIFTILFATVIPMLLRDVLAQFRPTNWVLRITSDGVWINLRSYKDPLWVAVSVAWLDYQEIASVGWHIEKYSTPTEMTGTSSKGHAGGDTMWKDQYLEFRLNHEQTSDLAAALNHLRSLPVSGEQSSGQAHVGTRHFTVWLVSPAVLRIIWTSGHGHVVAPPITSAINELETYAQRAQPTERVRPSWRKLTPPEVDELACELVIVHGAQAEAVALLVRAGGFTDAAARTIVERFEDGSA